MNSCFEPTFCTRSCFFLIIHRSTALFLRSWYCVEQKCCPTHDGSRTLPYHPPSHGRRRTNYLVLHFWSMHAGALYATVAGQIFHPTPMPAPYTSPLNGSVQHLKRFTPVGPACNESVRVGAPRILAMERGREGGEVAPALSWVECPLILSLVLSSGGPVGRWQTLGRRWAEWR